jgi:hypothetical protein
MSPMKPSHGRRMRRLWFLTSLSLVMFPWQRWRARKGTLSKSEVDCLGWLIYSRHELRQSTYGEANGYSHARAGQCALVRLRHENGSKMGISLWPQAGSAEVDVLLEDFRGQRVTKIEGFEIHETPPPLLEGADHVFAKAGLGTSFEPPRHYARLFLGVDTYALRIEAVSVTAEVTEEWLFTQAVKMGEEQIVKLRRLGLIETSGPEIA